MEQNQNNGPKNDGPKNKQSLLVILLCIMVSLVMFNVLGRMTRGVSSEVPYSQFIEMLEKGEVDRVVMKGETLTVTLKKQQKMGTPATLYTTLMEDASELVKRLEKAGVEDFNREKPNAATEVLYTILSLVLPVLLMFFLLSMLYKRMSKNGGMMGGVGKSKAKAYVQKETGITFKDVAGQDEAKESLQEVVDFLHNPGKYTTIGAKLPKGALLVGPPGTGKTLLAKAVAGEAHVPFFSLSGSDFVEMFVGVGASRVRDLFEEAKKNAPCIIFIDEVDAIGKSRDARYGGNDEREQTLNQLLAEMDGFDTSKGLLILAATNRPEVLDPALLRPGRFDRRVIVDRPDLKGRVNILKVHLVGKEKKDRILSQEERKIVSYHEVGHALVSALQKDSEPVQKITIVPRTMGALGYVMHVPEEEKFLNTKKELEAMLVGYLGGRAAEELVFDTVTTGAANDIEQATKVARAMITQYGMSDRFGLMGLSETQNQYLDGRAVLNCGDATATEIDHEVMKLLKKSYDEAKRLLSENRDVMDKIAEFLIQKETITGKEFMKIFHEAKGIEEPKAQEKPVELEASEAPEIPENPVVE